LHEEMISPDDSRRTLDIGDRFVVMPLFADWGYKPPSGKVVEDGFCYRSDTNRDWLSEEKLRFMLDA